MSEGGEWVTVPEAARRLGIGERRAYRLASGLSDSDRQMSDKRQTLVRQTALEEALERRSVEAEGVRQASDSVRQASDSAGAGVGHPSDMAQQLVDQLRSENAYLRAALEREQATAAGLVAQLRDADQRLAAVLASTGRLQIGVPEGVTSESTEEATSRGGDSVRTEMRPSWWSRLWKKGHT